MTWKFTRIFCGIYKKYWRKNQPEAWSEEPTSPGGAGPPSRAWQACGALGAPPPPTLALFSPFRPEKNQGEEFIAFYNTGAPPPPVLHLEGRSGVRSGLRTGEIVAVVITNLPSWPIP